MGSFRKKRLAGAGGSGYPDAMAGYDPGLA
jgi:hypothetical protein